MILPPSESLVGFRRGDESPFKLFYARPSASAVKLGIIADGRSIVRFQVRAPAPALKSYASGFIDTWSILADGRNTTVAPRVNSTGMMVLGGGIQLLIPNSPTLLTMI